MSKKPTAPAVPGAAVSEQLKYPFIFLGDCMLFSKKIKKELYRIQSYAVGTYNTSTGEGGEIIADLYADLDDKDSYADMYYIFLDYGNYMFSFHILDAAYDCIQDLKTKDIEKINKTQYEARYQYDEQVSVKL